LVNKEYTLKRFLIITLLSVIGVCALPVFAEELSPFIMPTTRSNGFGGHHVAYTDDIYALFVNPAALQNANQRSIFVLSPAFTGPLFDFIDIAEAAVGGDNDATLDALAKVTGKSEGKLPIGLDIRGPLALGYASSGLGWGVWNRIYTDINVVGTYIDVAVNVDGLFNFGLSMKILDTEHHAVDAGLVVKAFTRVNATQDIDALDMVAGKDIMDNFSIPVIAGGGFDVGFMYHWRKNLAVGLVFDDIYSGGGTVAELVGDSAPSAWRVPFTMNIGAAYTLPSFSDMGLSMPAALDATRIAFMADYSDIVNLFQGSDYTKRNPILGISVGMDVQLFNILHLRCGLNEMLPALGAGVSFGAFKLDVAYYGEELSKEPGNYTTYALDLTIAIQPKVEPKVRAWNKTSLVELISGGGGAEESGTMIE
jgi:hypothetical protein